MSLPSNQHNSLSFVKRIRDEIFGFIGVTELELEIIDSEAFQRLRRIKQLGLKDFVYPGATHTRFSHSIGVLHLAHLIIQHLKQNNKDFEVSKDQICKLRLAALLHDIGHYPFSHVIEQVMKNPEQRGQVDPSNKVRGKHENNSEFFILHTEIAEILAKDTFTPQELIAIIQGKRTGEPVVFNQIISSELDVDRLDYLLRDSHHCGVAYGLFDLNRLLNVLVVKDDMLYVRSRGRHAVEGYLLARYQMFNQVYVHQVALGFELLLQKAYECLMNATNDTFPTLREIQANPNDFLDFDDIFVMNIIKQVAKGSISQHIPDFGKQLCERIYRRKPLKPASPYSCFESPDEQKTSQTREVFLGINNFFQDEETINKIAEVKGVSKEWIIKGETSSEIMKLHPRFGNDVEVIEEDKAEYDDSIWLFDMNKNQKQSLSVDKSSIMRQLAGRTLTTICVYTLPELKDDVHRDITKKILRFSELFKD